MSRCIYVFCLLVAWMALAQASSIYRYRNKQSTVPRSSLLISGRGYMPGFSDMPTSSILLRKRGVGYLNVQEDKRSGRSVGTPRSGLLISGRGWLPGFYEQDWTDRLYL